MSFLFRVGRFNQLLKKSVPMNSDFFKLFISLLLVLSPACSTVASAPPGPFYFVSSNTLNVRSKPNTSSKIVLALKRGEEVKTVRKTGDGKWWEIRSPVRGFVYAKYIAVKKRGLSQSKPVSKACWEEDRRDRGSLLMVGIQLGKATPQSRSLENGTTVGLTVDQQHSENSWIGFRLAINRMETVVKDEGLTVSSSDFKFSTTSIYVAYRPGFQIFGSGASSSGLVNDLRVFPLLGVSAITSRLENNTMSYKETSSGAGLIAGGGLITTWETLAIGFEYLLIYQKASFDRSGEMHTGSNQLLLTIGMVF